jgi:hypothetical protein
MLFLYAGLVYLAAIAVVLILKPAFMFRPDGSWKEFGIGRNPKNYTPLPLWLYSIVAALVSYFAVLLISQMGGAGVSSRNRRNMINIDEELITNISPKEVSPELTPGYYILNKAASRAAGIPKYVYIGKEAP